MTDMLIWRDAWLLGIKELDDEHKEMARLLNQLVCSGKTADKRVVSIGCAQVGKIDPSITLLHRVNALISHLRNHFKKEEAFLQLIDYPRYLDHKHGHMMEMAEFIQLRRELKESGAHSLDHATLLDIKGWFFNHVISEDKRFASYYFEHYEQRDVAV